MLKIITSDASSFGENASESDVVAAVEREAAAWRKDEDAVAVQVRAVAGAFIYDAAAHQQQGSSSSANDSVLFKSDDEARALAVAVQATRAGSSAEVAAKKAMDDVVLPAVVKRCVLSERRPR